MADGVMRKQIAREINYRWPRGRGVPKYVQQQALDEATEAILDLFTPLREENADLRRDLQIEHEGGKGLSDEVDRLRAQLAAAEREKSDREEVCTLARDLIDALLRIDVLVSVEQEGDVRARLAALRRERDEARAIIRKLEGHECPLGPNVVWCSRHSVYHTQSFDRAFAPTEAPPRG